LARLFIAPGDPRGALCGLTPVWTSICALLNVHHEEGVKCLDTLEVDLSSTLNCMHADDKLGPKDSDLAMGPCRTKLDNEK
jgi:hypothetical protein